MRRFGEPFVNGKKYQIRPGAYAILVANDKILLTHQNHPIPEFQLPGGGIDAGENPLPALYREILEETGWSATGLRKIGTYKRFTYMPDYSIWAEKRCHIYLGRPVMNKKVCLEQHHAAVLVPIKVGLSLLTNAGDQFFAKSVLR